MLTNHFSYCQISSSFPSFLLLQWNQFESLFQRFAFNWKALPNAILNNVVTDVHWYWLFVKSVFKREHLTGICSVVYFHHFPSRQGEPQEQKAIRALALCQKIAETPSHSKRGAGSTNTSVNKADGWVLFISSSSPHDGGDRGREGLKLFVSFSSKNKRSCETSSLLLSSAELSEDACGWGWSHTALHRVLSSSASSFCLLRALDSSLCHSPGCQPYQSPAELGWWHISEKDLVWQCKAGAGTVGQWGGEKKKKKKWKHDLPFLAGPSHCCSGRQFRFVWKNREQLDD